MRPLFSSRNISAWMAIGAGFCAGLASAASVTYDFDTDQSSSFVVFEQGGPDSTTDFQYDYSTHVQDAPATQVAIPSAPNSTGGTTTGVRIAVNLSLAANNSVTLYPDVTGLDFSGGKWEMTFDVWGNHNGDANGNTGSTEGICWGAAVDTTAAGVGPDAIDGFNYIMTSDGGSAGFDYRYYSGATAPTTNDNTIPNWWGTGVTDNNAAEWVAFFPNDGTLGTPPTGSANQGCPGKQWVTVKLRATNLGSTREVFMKKSGDADFTLVSTINGGVGSFNRPCIGYWDMFTGSINSEPTDQFVAFDNLTIDDLPTPPAVEGEWTQFE